MHISRLELENFKRFSSAAIDLSGRINVLLGPNSSGKSSVIKAILALKQTASTTNENETLATQGDYVDLGVYKDYVFDHKIEHKIRITTTVEDILQVFPLSSLGHKSLRISLVLGHDHATEQARLLEIHATEPVSGNPILSICKKTTRDTYSISISEDAAISFAANVLREPSKTRANTLVRSWARGLSVRIDDRYVITLEKRPQENKKSYQGEPDLVLFYARSIIDSFFRGLDKEFFYLGPLRRSPSRSYARTGHLLSVGPAGEHTPSVLANLKARAAKERSVQQVQRRRLNQFNEWMQTLFPGRIVEAKSLDELVKLLISRSDSRGDAISDVGFGISQILPILVQIAVMPDRSTLLIEQPELHLHPSVQTRLAEVLAAASQSGRRFIVETHSEHFVRGLQLAISNERTKRRSKFRLGAKDVRFVYVPEAPKRPIVLEVNEWGEFLEEWPPGFFDEAYRLSMQLLQNKMRAISGEGEPAPVREA